MMLGNEMTMDNLPENFYFDDLFYFQSELFGIQKYVGR